MSWFGVEYALGVLWSPWWAWPVKARTGCEMELRLTEEEIGDPQASLCLSTPTCRRGQVALPSHPPGSPGRRAEVDAGVKTAGLSSVSEHCGSLQQEG